MINRLYRPYGLGVNLTPLNSFDSRPFEHYLCNISPRNVRNRGNPYMKNRPLALTGALLLSAQLAFASGSINLLGQTALPDQNQIGDVWGYVDPSTNKEYAITGDLRSARIWIVDVSDPTNPNVVATVAGVPGFDVKVYQHYIYCCDGNMTGTDSRIVDIADPANPVVKPISFPSTHNVATSSNGYLFLEKPGIKIFDISDPEYPTFVWRDGYGDGHDCIVVDNRLYDFRGSLGLYLWDITNPAAPVQLGNIYDSSIVFYHSGAPTEDHQYLFNCDELATGDIADISVWDISTPQLPVRVKSINDPTSTVHNLFVVGNYAYVSYYTAGFKVFDISDPTNPVIADHYDTSALSGERLFNGAFGVYPFAPSGNVYVSDVENGLFIFDFNPITTPTFITSFDTRVSGTAVELRWQLATDEDLAGFRVYRREADSQRSLTVVNPGGLLQLTARRFSDDHIVPGILYDYVLGVVRADGSEIRSRPSRVRVPRSDVVLEQNFPNPFNPITTIAYQLDQAGPVSLVVYDPRGKTVRTLVDAPKPAGTHATVWDGRSDLGRAVSSGVYFYKIRARGLTLTRRMVLLK